MKIQIHLFTIFFTLIGSLLTPSAYALTEGTYQVIIRKQAEKVSARWTLLDWMNTKKKMALMDQWLALNSSVNHLEFSAYGEQKKGKIDNTKNDGVAAGLSLSYRIFGLEGSWSEIENTIHEKSGKFALRVFGKSDQGPNIKFFYGMSSQKDFNLDKTIIKPTFYGGSTTIYLLPFLGGHSEYAIYSKETIASQNIEVNSDRISLGLFLQISFLRLYGNVEKIRIHYNENGIESDRHIKSTNFGAKIFF